MLAANHGVNRSSAVAGRPYAASVLKYRGRKVAGNRSGRVGPLAVVPSFNRRRLRFAGRGQDHFQPQFVALVERGLHRLVEPRQPGLQHVDRPEQIDRRVGVLHHPQRRIGIGGARQACGGAGARGLTAAATGAGGGWTATGVFAFAQAAASNRVRKATGATASLREI